MTNLAPINITPQRSSALIKLTTTLLPAVLLIALAGPGVLSAQETKLPKAEKILDRFVDVTGGKAAYAKFKNRVTKMSLEMPAMGVKMKVITYAARPNKAYSVFESADMGKTERGCDGKVVWEVSAMTGPQIKEGEEREFFMRNYAFDRDEAWRKLYKKAECTAVEEVDGKPCYKVVLTPKTGQPETRSYDKESGLLVKLSMIVASQMGDMPVDLFLSDYKRVDGVLMAHKIKQVFSGQELLIVTESVEHNVKLPEDRFDLPEEIQDLIDEKKSEVGESKEP